MSTDSKPAATPAPAHRAKCVKEGWVHAGQTIAVGAVVEGLDASQLDRVVKAGVAEPVK